ncbi:MAG: hypothetical protein V3T23_01745 [Nitrososphaerales archaeon]
MEFPKILEDLPVGTYSHSRGNLVVWLGDRWVYQADGMPHDDTKRCVECKLPHTPWWEPDVCIGRKPGIKNMCCGHGRRVESIYMPTLRLQPGEVR